MSDQELVQNTDLHKQTEMKDIRVNKTTVKMTLPLPLDKVFD